MKEPATDEASRRRWGMAWTALVAALAVHVYDEATTGFLELWNPMVSAARSTIPWLPLPTFEYEGWLGGLIVAIALLSGLSWFVFHGATWMRPVCYFLGALMVGNAFGHMAASVYLGRPAPGVTSSPILLAAAVALLWTTRRAAIATHHRTPGPLSRVTGSS